MTNDENENPDLKFYERLKKCTGCRNISELAVFFGVDQSIVAEWKKDAALPFIQQSFLKLRGVNTEWLETGRGKARSAVPTGTGPGLKVACPLKADIRKMLFVCESCAAWAGIMKTNLE